jgi:membrane-associated protease RseP (regulator of RpoE activity)
MHFMLALVALFALFAFVGVPNHKDWYIRNLDPTGPAQAAGLVEGDRILSINGTPLQSYDDLAAVVAPLADTPTTLTVLRAGQTFQVPLQIAWRLTHSGEAGIDGLLYNERVLAVNGTPVTTYADFLSLVEEGKTYQVHAYGVQGNDTVEFDVTVTINSLDRTSGSKGYLGVGLDAHDATVGPFTAIGRTFSKFGQGATASLKGVAAFFSPDGLGRTFTDAITPSNPSSSTQTPTSDAERVKTNSAENKRAISIIGAARVGKQTADSSGPAGLLAFLAFLNVAIGVFNLLPLLPLDGGHIAVATYERIRSRKGRAYHADFAKLLPVTYVVVLFLVSLFVVTSLRDIFNPINVPR